MAVAAWSSKVVLVKLAPEPLRLAKVTLVPSGPVSVRIRFESFEIVIDKFTLRLIIAPLSPLTVVVEVTVERAEIVFGALGELTVLSSGGWKTPVSPTSS